MSTRFVKPTTGRIIAAVSFSIFFLKLPNLMPMDWKWGIILIVSTFFLAFPVIKGIKGGLLAAFFSLIFAGLGQLYVKEYGRGILFIIVAVFAHMTINYSAKSWVFNNILFVISAVDAFSLGKRGIGIL